MSEPFQPAASGTGCHPATRQTAVTPPLPEPTTFGAMQGAFKASRERAVTKQPFDAIAAEVRMMLSDVWTARLSDAVIALRCGCSREYVCKQRRRLQINLRPKIMPNDGYRLQ